MGMPLSRWFVERQCCWDVQTGVTGHDEQAGSWMREKMGRIENKTADSVSRFSESGNYETEILTGVRRQRADDVLQNDQLWNPTGPDTVLNEFPERSERSASFPIETGA